MDRQEFAAWEERIRARADLLWQEAGKPEGSRDRFLEEARELVAIAENPGSGALDPEDSAEPITEEASLLANLGEFTGLGDRQGEEPSFPAPENVDPSGE